MGVQKKFFSVVYLLHSENNAPAKNLLQMLGNTISPSFPHNPWLCVRPGANFKVNGKFRKLREISYCDILSDYL